MTKKFGNSIYFRKAGRTLICHGYKWKYYEHEIENEIWKDLTINDRRIEVSSYGRVRQNGSATYGSKTKAGYYSSNINFKPFLVHRLVCMAFKPIENEQDYVVNHIDNIKSNNHIDNLEWVTQQENSIHAQAFERKPYNRYRGVVKLTTDNIVIENFKSLTEAGEKSGLKINQISSVCLGYKKTAGGFKWKYLN